MKKLKSSIIDLGVYSEASKKEGFCLLHQGMGEKWSLVYQNPVKKFSHLPKELKGLTTAIGYLAYPNPTLKNGIEQEKFYGFNKGKKHLHKNGEKIYQNAGIYKTSGKLEQSVTKSEYVKKIKKIKELLVAGEIYQLNYAVRFRKKFEDHPYALFLKWIESSPSSFSAFINCGTYQILSNSPERLFRYKNGEIMTQPIKGTIIKLPAPSSQLQALLASQKDKAELDMITDLARNDIGKICKYGTLKLRKNRAVLELSNLWHTYSEVRGKVDKNIKISDMMDALFPGGSITGCPKKRAMEYIEKLEDLPRNIFTGSIGYIKKLPAPSSKLQADFNIAIRTAFIKDGYVEYWAGGGIVADSDPEAEYAECLLKAEKFLNIL